MRAVCGPGFGRSAKLGAIRDPGVAAVPAGGRFSLCNTGSLTDRTQPEGRGWDRCGWACRDCPHADRPPWRNRAVIRARRALTEIVQIWTISREPEHPAAGGAAALPGHRGPRQHPGVGNNMQCENIRASRDPGSAGGRAGYRWGSRAQQTLTQHRGPGCRRSQDRPAPSASERKRRVRYMQSSSRSAPMKPHPAFLAPSAVARLPRRNGSQTTWPGRANRSTIIAIPTSTGCHPSCPSGRSQGWRHEHVISAVEGEAQLPIDRRRPAVEIDEVGSARPALRPAELQVELHDPPQFRVLQAIEVLRQTRGAVDEEMERRGDRVVRGR